MLCHPKHATEKKLLVSYGCISWQIESSCSAGAAKLYITSLSLKHLWLFPQLLLS